tara:strand:- start:6423 stop:7943 length:1521 start_codon:yes stop_codon:yes gene_type:complete
MDIFGYEISKKVTPKVKKEIISPIPKPSEDGSSTTTVFSGGLYGQYIDLGDSATISDHDLILKYREVATQPEADTAITDIVDGAIASRDKSAPVNIALDDLDQPENIKKQIIEEFNKILTLYRFNHNGHDLFRNWYIDGRVYFQIIVDKENPKRGIVELRYIDPTKISKVKEVKKVKDARTEVEYDKIVAEYYLYSEGMLSNSDIKTGGGVKLEKDSIIAVNSGLFDPSRTKSIGYLHKAIKLINQLRFMEDSLVVYRVSRAPERRIFYIDVGNLPKGKAEEYVQSVVSRYRNKLVYDASTGEITDDRKHMSMLEDFYLPRREGGRGTEITTLGGGENLGQIDDVVFFQRKLYRSLNVPISRLEQDTGFALGRATEVSRDEVKFQKFVDKIRKRFSQIFIEALKVQLILKGVIEPKDWPNIEESINVDFIEDNYFAELKEFEILRERLEMLQLVEEQIGQYYSREWVRRNILHQSDEDIHSIDDQIKKEKESGDIDDDEGEEDLEN